MPLPTLAASLEQDELRRARSRATRSKQLTKVVTDPQNDITSRIDSVEQTAVQTFEGLADRVKANGVVRQAAQLPEHVTGQVTSTMDELLDRVGLVRKAVHQEAVRAAIAAGAKGIKIRVAGRLQSLAETRDVPMAEYCPVASNESLSGIVQLYRQVSDQGLAHGSAGGEKFIVHVVGVT